MLWIRTALVVLGLAALSVAAVDPIPLGVLRGADSIGSDGRELKTGSDRKDKPHRRRYECSAHPTCVAAGLTSGDCCPTLDNVFLDCCGTSSIPRNEVKPSVSPSVAPSSSPTSGACSAHTVCADMGLTGQCCPTIQGDILDCCNDTS